MSDTDTPTLPTDSPDAARRAEEGLALAGRGPVQIDRKKPAAAQIYDHLRGLIVSLAIAPGSTLGRAALADLFGVSQTPVREALLRLEEEGLVDTYPQSATKVSRIDLQSVREAQFLRVSVELEVARKLAGEPGCDLFPAETLIARQERALEVGDIEAFAAADRQMHRTLMEIAGVSGLWAVIRSRSGHLDRLRHLHLPAPGKARSVVEEHRAVLEAIGQGDPDAAQAAMRRHLSGTIASVEELRERFPGYLKG